jgi:hypothetical protein
MLNRHENLAAGLIILSVAAGCRSAGESVFFECQNVQYAPSVTILRFDESNGVAENLSHNPFPYEGTLEIADQEYTAHFYYGGAGVNHERLDGLQP